jgi:hypothetical protein
MAGHSSLPNHADWAMEQLNLHYNQLLGEFLEFFKEVSEMSKAYLDSENINGHRAI